MERRNTRLVRIGDRCIGGKGPILIQTMADIKTSHVKDILSLEDTLYKAGNDLLRLSVLDEEDAKAFEELVRFSHVPLIADIHFNYRFALLALDKGASAVRLNPGNIQNPEELKLVILKAQEKKAAVRIGVNSGSLPKKYLEERDEASAYVAIVDSYLKFFEAQGFYDLVLSLKSSSPKVTRLAYEQAAEAFNYPLHIGLTEAGPSYLGAVRSASALVPLLNEGIGDTIRISLTDPPLDEVLCAKELLSSLGLKEGVPQLVSCPTCGRTQVDLFPIAKEVAAYLADVKVPIKVAVMGCPVNGPGEAKDADIGIAGGVSTFLLFKKGKPLKVLSQKEALKALEDGIDEIIKEKAAK